MSGQRGGDAAAFERIVALEGELDRQLQNHSPQEPFAAAFVAALREWSECVWVVAQSLGPSEIAPVDVQRGLALAQRPVFICGVQRSGTTHLRDLLDGHPELAVVPAESQFYISLESTLFALGTDNHSAYLGRQWLGQLIMHPPYWLLGRSQPTASPYVNFARDFAAWWPIGERYRDARIPSWPLAAFALAYAKHLGDGQIPSGVRMWVEKSPTSERFIDKIWRDFPAARILHLVREPAAVLASFKAAKRYEWNPARAASMTLRQMAPGYRLAAESNVNRPRDRYLLVRYEDLVATPEEVMARVAEFLGIEPLPILHEPTIAGRPARNNSSYANGRPRSLGALNRFERILLALGTRRWARRLGY